VLKRMQAHLAEADQDARLVILTEGALTTNEAEAPNLAAASLAGLVRSAAAEHPGRFCLIDTDGSEASEAALKQAFAVDLREAEIALREGELLVPRLTAVKDEAADPTELDPDRTVLITGATGGIGALIAEHLVATHGARHLLLVSRSGESAPGALDLRARLAEQGAEVEIAACDVSERSQLETLLAGVPKEHPLGAIIHCAAVLDDGLLESMDQERLERVFAPKADAAWHLHELSAGFELTHFVCFSSIAGLLGSPAQANYAAANAFLDGLAAHRRATGLAGSSMAWGLWLEGDGMASRLAEADLARMRRGGIAALSEQQGLDLFDRVLAGSRALGIAARFDRAVLRREAAAGGLVAKLERVAGPRQNRAGAQAGALARRLREAPQAKRGQLAEDFVRAEVAAILGHSSAAAIGLDEVFKDLGFDSLAAIELRNRLSAASDRRLAASVVFDYPTTAALAAHLLGEAADVKPAAAASRPTRLAAQIEEASDEELLEFIDTQVGSDRG
jgi:NADP-dependent 3-hydroxy acid dehydrogenase YdfG/acyl carrier protein